MKHDGLLELVTVAPVAVQNDFRRRVFRPGQTIIEQDSNVAEFHVVLTGTARAYRDNEDGKRFAIALFKPGDFFGESALIPDTTRLFTIAAVEETSTIVIGRKTLIVWIESDHGFSGFLNYALATRINTIGQREVASQFLPLRIRLFDVLQAMRKESGEHGFKIFPNSMAENLGVTVRSVFRALAELEQSGAILRKGGYVRFYEEPSVDPERQCSD